MKQHEDKNEIRRGDCLPDKDARTAAAFDDYQDRQKTFILSLDTTLSPTIQLWDKYEAVIKTVAGADLNGYRKQKQYEGFPSEQMSRGTSNRGEIKNAVRKLLKRKWKPGADVRCAYCIKHARGTPQHRAKHFASAFHVAHQYRLSPVEFNTILKVAGYIDGEGGKKKTRHRRKTLTAEEGIKRSRALLDKWEAARGKAEGKVEKYARELARYERKAARVHKQAKPPIKAV